MSEQNKAITRRLREECVSTGNMALADELLDQNYVYHGPAIMEELRGREAFKQAITGFRAALPDLREVVEDQIAEGDKVMSRFVSRGTHTGELMGAAPTDSQITIRGIDISRSQKVLRDPTCSNTPVHGVNDRRLADATRIQCDGTGFFDSSDPLPIGRVLMRSSSSLGSSARASGASP